MKYFMQQRGVDISREPISHSSKICILSQLYSRPGSKVVRGIGGQLVLQHGRFEFPVARLCEARRRWR